MGCVATCAFCNSKIHSSMLQKVEYFIIEKKSIRKLDHTSFNLFNKYLYLNLYLKSSSDMFYFSI